MLKNTRIIVSGFFDRSSNIGILLADRNKDQPPFGVNGKTFTYNNIEVQRPISIDELNLPKELVDRFSHWVSIYNKAFNSTPFAIYEGRDIDEIGMELAKELKKYLDDTIELVYVDKYRESKYL